MALTYGPAFTQTLSWRSYGTFLGHRLARLYPLYAVVIVSTALLLAGGVLTDPPWPSARLMLANLLLVQAWGLTESLVHPSWSISTEWAAYLLFPILLAASAWTRGRDGCLAGLACAGVIVAIAYLPRPVLGILPSLPHGPLDVNQATSFAPVLRCIAGFTLGIVTFRCSQQPWAARAIRLRMAADLAFGTTLGLLCLPGSDLLVYAALPVDILLLSGGSSCIGTILSSRPVHTLGVLSYAIYLLHHRTGDIWKACIAQFADEPTAIQQGLASVATGGVVIAAAAVCHIAIEKPGRVLGRALLHRSAWPGRTSPAELGRTLPNSTPVGDI